MTSKLSSDKAVIRGYILYAAWVKLVKNSEEIFKELCHGESLKAGEQIKNGQLNLKQRHGTPHTASTHAILANKNN